MDAGLPVVLAKIGLSCATGTFLKDNSGPGVAARLVSGQRRRRIRAVRANADVRVVLAPIVEQRRFCAASHDDTRKAATADLAILHHGLIPGRAEDAYVPGVAYPAAQQLDGRGIEPDQIIVVRRLVLAGVLKAHVRDHSRRAGTHRKQIAFRGAAAHEGLVHARADEVDAILEFEFSRVGARGNLHRIARSCCVDRGLDFGIGAGHEQRAGG